MPALRWAAAAAVVGVLAGDVALAAADPPPEPTPTATPTPTTTPAATPTPTPTTTPTATPTPVVPFPTVTPVASGTTIYVMTVTTTTTEINAPITWVAAPITTTVSNTSATNGTTTNTVAGSGAVPPATLVRTGSGSAAKLEVDLSGCGATGRSTKTKQQVSPQRAQLRLPQSGTLVVRVNGKRVGSLQLPSTERGVPLRIVLGHDGMLSVRRPSGSVLRVRACKAAS